MFDSLFPKEWTTLQRLMWLKTNALARAVYETITGNPVSFSAKAAPLRKLEVAFSPVQNLNGYDSPWPAGGGKNKVNKDSMELHKWVSPNGTYSQNNCAISGKIPVKIGETYTISFLSSTKPYSFEICTFDSNDNYIDREFGLVQPISKTIESNAAYVIVGVSIGSDSSYYITQADIDAIKMMFVEGATEPTVWTPYSNICPISGWSSLHVYDDPLYAGVIEWNQQLKEISQENASMWAGLGANRRTFDGNVAVCVPNGDYSSTLHYGLGYDNVSLSMVSGHKYFCAGDAKSTKRNRFRLRFANVTKYSETVDAETWVTVEMIGVATVNLNVMTMYAEDDTAYTTDDKLYFRNIFLCDLTEMFGAGNEPATVEDFKALFPHDYYPYNAGTETLVGTVNGMDTRSISISLGETVYSGYVDVVTGVGEVTMGMVDLGSLSWTYNNTDPSNAYFRTESVTNIKPTGSVIGLCSAYNWIGSSATSNIRNGEIAKTINNSYVIFAKDSSYSDSDVFKTAVTGQKLVYELATPIPIQLTPQEVESLAGDNVLFSDANGDLTVEYRSN